MPLTALISRASSTSTPNPFNMKTFLHFARALLPTVVALVAGTAHAQITTNGDFESGAFTGWSHAGNLTIAPVTAYFGGLSPEQNGRFVAAFGGGNGPATGVLHQSVDTTVGQEYELVFEYGNFQSIGTGDAQSIGVAIVDANSLQTILTSTVVDSSGTIDPVTVFSSHAFRFVAISGRTTIAFSDLSNATFATDGLLDNLSLSAVPEPGSWALMAAGLLAVGGWARRRTTTLRRGA